MRHLVFICRPCLASIRKQQGQTLSRTAASPTTTPFIIRPRNSTLTTLRALRSKSTVATCPSTDSEALSKTAEGDSPHLPTKPPDTTSYEELARSIDAEPENARSGTRFGVVNGTPWRRHGVLEGDNHANTLEADREQARGERLLKTRTRQARSPEAEWDDVEAALFGAKYSNSGDEFDGMGRDVDDLWEAVCAANLNLTYSSNRLAKCSTPRELFDVIHANPKLRRELKLREREARTRWLAWWAVWFPAVAHWLSPVGASSSPLVLERFTRRHDIELVREKWQALSPLARRNRWPRLISKCLRSWPEGLPELLQVTVELGIARPYILHSAIRLLAERIQYYRRQDRRDVADSAVMSVVCVLRNSSNLSLKIHHMNIYNIMRFASTHKVFELYVELKKWGWEFPRDTRMQFASRFAKDANYKIHGLDLIRDMVHNNMLDINSVEGSALATSLLAIQNEGAYAPDRVRAAAAPEVGEAIHEALFNLGLIPNVITLTVIIQALCESRQLSKAWDVYQLMVDMGIEPDDHVFAVLLHGSKISADFVSLQRVVDLVIQHRIHNRCIWNGLLHTVFISALRESLVHERGARHVSPIFPIMCDVYKKFYRQEPLQRFLITDIKHHSLEASGAGSPPDWVWPYVRPIWSIISTLPSLEPLEPGVDSLYIMLLGYVRGFARPASIVAFYTHFEGLLKSGDPLVVQFVDEAGPKLHNLVLMALCDHPSMLRFALDILSNMIKDTIAGYQDAAAGIAESDRPTRHPTPDIRSWGIVLDGFMKNGYFKEAEAFLETMKKHGIPRQIATWNMLLTGYTRSNQMSKARNVLGCIQEEGLVPDDFTARIFKHLPDDETTAEMLELMERMTAQRQSLKTNPEKLLGKIYNHNASDGGSQTDNGGLQGALDEYQQLEAELDRIARTEPSHHRPALEKEG